MTTVSYVIVGAGPAGLQMAHLLAQAGLDFVVLEGGERAGGFFEAFPRHRKLLSINRRFNVFPEPDFNLRHDWNSLLSDDPDLKFTRYSDELFPDREDLARYLQDFAAPLADHIRYRTRVSRISRNGDGGFAVETDAGETYHAPRVLMATGAVGPYIPADIEGIEHADSYEAHSLDPKDYEGHTVAIIGSGNSAFEVADHLAPHAAIIHIMVRDTVRHAWNTHFPGDLRAINNTILDMYQLKSLHATLGFKVRQIMPSGDGGFFVVLEGEQPHWVPPATTTFPFRYDHVIRCTGWRYVDPTIFAPDCVPDMDVHGKYPVLSSSWESSIPGLYFIGTAMAARDRTAATPFIHGFRYNVRTLFHLLQERHHSVPLPAREYQLKSSDDVRALALDLIKRMSTAGSLYQQFGVLGDVVVLSDHQARWHQALPVDYLRERADLGGGDVIIATLDYGFSRYPSVLSKLDFIKPHDPDNPACSAFLHPVFRHYHDGEMTEELHFGESLLVRYDREMVVGSIDDNLDGNPYLRLLSNFIGRKMGSGEEPLRDPLFPPELLHWTITPWDDERQSSWTPMVADMSKECRYAL